MILCGVNYNEDSVIFLSINIVYCVYLFWQINIANSLKIPCNMTFISCDNYYMTVVIENLPNRMTNRERYALVSGRDKGWW